MIPDLICSPSFGNIWTEIIGNELPLASGLFSNNASLVEWFYHWLSIDLTTIYHCFVSGFFFFFFLVLLLLFCFVFGFFFFALSAYEPSLPPSQTETHFIVASISSWLMFLLIFLCYVRMDWWQSEL